MRRINLWVAVELVPDVVRHRFVLHANLLLPGNNSLRLQRRRSRGEPSSPNLRDRRQPILGRRAFEEPESSIQLTTPSGTARRASALTAVIMYLVRPRPFHGEAAKDTPAPLEQCFVLLAAVDRYPDWCPDIIRHVDVLDRGAGGQPSRVRMTIHIARAALVREFNLFLAVVVEPPRVVKLTRVTDHPTNQEFNATWRLRPNDSTRIALRLDAQLRVPWYIRASGVGDTIAKGFVQAACTTLAAASR